MTKLIKTLSRIAPLLRRGLCSSPLELEMAEMDELIKGLRASEFIEAGCISGSPSSFLQFVSHINRSWSSNKKSVMGGFPPELQGRLTKVEQIVGNSNLLNPELLAKALLHPSCCPSNHVHRAEYASLVHDGLAALEIASVKFNRIFGGFDESVPDFERMQRLLFLEDDGCTIFFLIKRSVFGENYMLARSVVASGLVDLVKFQWSPELTTDIENLRVATRANDFSYLPSKSTTTLLSDTLKAICGSTLRGSLDIDNLFGALRRTLAPDSNPVVCLYVFTRAMGGSAPLFQLSADGSYKALAKHKTNSYPSKPAKDDKIVLGTGSCLTEAAWNALIIGRGKLREI